MTYKLHKEYSSKKGFFFHVFLVPIYVFGMLLLFFPSAFRNYGLLFNRYSFHVTMVFCIVLLVMLITRLVFMLLHWNGKEVSWGSYFLLGVSEIVFSSGFTALYFWLVSRKTEAFFTYFGLSLIYLFVLMLIPYLTIHLYFLLTEKDSILEQRTRDTSKEKIRFFDERNNLKLVVAVDAVLYIQSEENYLKILYLEQNELKYCTIRNTMKRIEDLCSRNGLVRCHRSYYVNKTHVQALQKDKEFTYAVLDVPSASRVPVSKNYYEQITSLL